MPPAIENAVYGRGKPAWHNLGTVLDGVLTPEEVYRAVPQLAALVERVDITTVEGHPGHQWYANVRRDFDADHVKLPIEQRIVGVVKGRYEIVMPFEQVEMTALACDVADFTIEAAGTLRDGSVTWLLLHAPEPIEVVGDHIDPYICVVNSYDASYSLTWITTDIRVECQNLLNLALAKAKRRFALRHTSGVKDRDAVARAIAGSLGYTREVAAAAERLAAIKVSSKAATAFINRLVPLPEVRVSQDTGMPLGQRARDNAEVVRAAIREIHDRADDLANHRDTAWGWLNAVGAFMDHAKETRNPERKLEQAWGETSTMKDRALKLLTVSSA